jgi:hypothetical protein
MENIRKYRIVEDPFSEPHYVTDKGTCLFESDFGEFPLRKEMKMPCQDNRAEGIPYKDNKLVMLFRNEDDSSYIQETFKKIEETYADLIPIVLENYLHKGSVVPKNTTRIIRYSMEAQDVLLNGSIIQNSYKKTHFCLVGNILNPIVTILETNYFHLSFPLRTSYVLDTLFNGGRYIGPPHLGFGLILDGEDDKDLLNIKSLNGLISTSNKLSLLNLPNLESVDDLKESWILRLRNTPKLKNLKSYEGAKSGAYDPKIILSVGSSPCMESYNGHVYFDKSSRPDNLFIFNEEEDLSDMPVEEYNWRKYVAANIDLSSLITVMSSEKLSSILFDFEKEIINRRIKGEEVITTLTIQNN